MVKLICRTLNSVQLRDETVKVIAAVQHGQPAGQCQSYIGFESGSFALLFCFFFFKLQVGRKHRNETKGQWTPTHTPTQSRNFMTVATQLKGLAIN